MHKGPFIFYQGEGGGQWDLGGGALMLIRLKMGGGGGVGIKIKSREESHVSNIINYGVGHFFYTNREGGQNIFVRATKENAPHPLWTIPNRPPLVLKHF